jgi:hypothetical protein
VRIVTLLLYHMPALDTADPAPSLPALGFVLGRGARTRPPQVDAISWLCSRFGLSRQPDWPVAPLLARAAGLAAPFRGWLCADPVHLELRQGHAIVAPPAPSLSETESTQMVTALDRHFRECDLRFFAFDRNRWLINTSLPAAFLSSPLPAAGGHIAGGPDAARWNALLTEAQMLLHAHPVNSERLTRSEPEVNSLHLWGAGTDPQPRPADALVAGDDPLLLALAAAATVPVIASASDLLDRVQAGADASALVVPRVPESADAVAHWLAGIEHDWLAPLLHGARRGRIDRLEIVAAQPQALLGLALTPATVWRVWRAMRALGQRLSRAPTL